jgi:hypothetical protein
VAGLLGAGLLAGCAETTAKGGIIGATGGAIVGAATAGAHTGRNAALGAVIGGLLGALAGEAYHQREIAVAASQPPPPPPPPAPPPAAGAPPPGPWSVVTSPTPPPPVGPPSAAARPPDPTQGMVTNGTQWEIHVFMDNPPGTPGPLVLQPGMQVPVVLDIGQHRIIAQAYVDTQLGRRLVGTFDQTLSVDARAPGWTIHFFPANF